MRTLVIGDIHGNYKGLMQALERANFDYEKDTLISLGDVVDGHSQSYEVVEELLKIKNLIAIKGNHDDWFNHWFLHNVHGSGWGQGAKATGMSYLDKSRPNVAWWVPDLDNGGMNNLKFQ
jgi:serine/threonine protein phosphatase 1